MSVYVDSYNVTYGRMKMNHMIADTTEELLNMAEKIGVAKKWIQNSGKPDEHFDICLSKKREALNCGAIEIMSRQLVEIIRQKREKK